MAALSKAEAAVYDRQIRVWGVDTQQRLNAAKILIAGTGGLVAEVAKNVVLAGAGLVALMDDTPIGSAPGTSFLLPADALADQTVAQVSVAALQEMNPLVKVALVPGSAATADASLVADYDVVLLVSPSLTLLRRYDEACRQHSIAFFGAASRGACSFFFVDLQSHTYASTEQQDGKPKSGQHTSQFCSLAEALQAPWSSLRPKRTHELYYGLRVITQYETAHQQQLPQSGDAAALEQLARDTAAAAGTDADRTARAAAGYAFGDRELPPVNAVLGGLLANELLKAISHKGEPVNNWLFYSLSSGVAQIETTQLLPT